MSIQAKVRASKDPRCGTGWKPVPHGFWLAALVIVAVTRAAFAEVTVPFPKSYVTDLANIVEAGMEQRLEGWLAELNQKTKAFVLVLTGTPPNYPEYYAQWPDCNAMFGDINGDGTVDSFDIDPFVELLTAS